jgi:hypothetical protein
MFNEKFNVQLNINSILFNIILMKNLISDKILIC